MKTLFAILPCYNEAENIGKLIDEWNKQRDRLKKQKYDLKIIGIDDCSTDDTQKQILSKKNEFDNVDIIIHEENKGLSGGLNSAIHYFNKKGNDGDLLVLMDGDNTHNPKYVHGMLGLLKDEKNCIIASRYRKGANIVGLAKSREMMSEFAKVYYKVTLNIPNVRDYTCGYRMYTYNLIDNLLKKFGDNPIKEKSFACMMELLYKVYLSGGKFDEVGFELRYDNKCGESKMNVLKTVRRSLTTAIKLKLKYNVSSIITAVALILFTILLSLGTNYSPMRNQFLAHDCSIFSYVAYAMQKGRVLYSGVWENKGPLLYFIYYFGLSMHKTFGIYLLELISILISVLFSYKTIKIITDKKIYSLIGVLYAFSIWTVTYEYGTISEHFALPLLCAGVFMFTKYMFRDKKASNKFITLFGILTGLIALLRLNLLSIFLALFITIGITLLINKSYKDILRWILFGLLGFVISLIPSLVYLIINGALMDCLNSAYLNILNGFNTGSLTERLFAIIQMIKISNISGVVYLAIGFALILFPILCFRKKTKKEIKLYNVSIVLALLLNLYANSISGAIHMHYFLTFIPIIVMLVGSFISLFDRIQILNIFKYMLITTFVLISICKSYLLYCKYYLEAPAVPFVQTQIDNFINNNSHDDDLVQLIGGGTESVGANFRTERLSASKYSYLPLWGSFTEDRKKIMTNELVEEVKENVPKLIFISNESKGEFDSLIEDKKEWNDFLSENYSIDVVSVNTYIIYIKM